MLCALQTLLARHSTLYMFDRTVVHWEIFRSCGRSRSRSAIAMSLNLQALIWEFDADLSDAFVLLLAFMHFMGIWIAWFALSSRLISISYSWTYRTERAYLKKCSDGHKQCSQLQRILRRVRTLFLFHYDWYINSSFAKVCEWTILSRLTFVHVEVSAMRKMPKITLLSFWHSVVLLNCIFKSGFLIDSLCIVLSLPYQVRMNISLPFKHERFDIQDRQRLPLSSAPFEEYAAALDRSFWEINKICFCASKMSLTIVLTCC